MFTEHCVGENSVDRIKETDMHLNNDNTVSQTIMLTNMNTISNVNIELSSNNLVKSKTQIDGSTGGPPNKD